MGGKCDARAGGVQQGGGRLEEHRIGGAGHRALVISWTSSMQVQKRSTGVQQPAHSDRGPSCC